MSDSLRILTAPPELFIELRQLVPSRPLTYGQARTLAERQATRTRRVLKSRDAALDLSWLLNRPDVTVTFRPEYKMPDNTSGMTTKINEQLVIFMNANELYLRQRFTLAHEFKHALDFEDAETIYSKLGSGDAELRANQVEWICNHFAACLLMPKLWVNRLWANGIQDPLAMAAIFKVSAEAMKVRLDTLGYFGATPRPHETFFRRPLLADEALAEVSLAELVLAA